MGYEKLEIRSWLIVSASLFFSFSKLAEIWLKDEWKMYEQEEIKAEQEI